MSEESVLDADTSEPCVRMMLARNTIIINR